jgi:hypothetical protein
MDEFDTVIVSLKLLSTPSQYLYSFLPAHNGHELIVPYILYALNFQIFSGSRASFMIFILIMQLLFLVLTLIYMRKLFGTKGRKYYFLLPLITLLIFNLSAFDYWSHIDDIPYSLASIFFFFSVMAFSNKSSKLNILITVSFFSVLCSFSLMNGLIVWPTCFIMLCFFRFPKKQIIFYTVLAICVIIFYRHFTDLSRSSVSAVSFCDRVEYGFVFLGGVVGDFFQNLAAAFYAGVFLFLLWISLSIYLLSKRSVSQDKNLFIPWIFLAFLPIGSAILGALGRAQFGTAQALVVRYEPLTALLWISCLVLSVYTFQHTKKVILYIVAYLVYTFMILGALITAIGFTGSNTELQIISAGLQQNVYINNHTIPAIYLVNDVRILSDLSYLRDNKLYFAAPIYNDVYIKTNLNSTETVKAAPDTYNLTNINVDTRNDSLPINQYGFVPANFISGALQLHHYDPKWFDSPRKLLFTDENNFIVGEALFDSPYFNFLNTLVSTREYSNNWSGYILNSAIKSDIPTKIKTFNTYLKYNREAIYHSLGTITIPVNIQVDKSLQTNAYLDEIYLTQSNQLKFRGWIYIKGAAANLTESFLLLTNNNDRYVFPLKKVIRADIATAFHDGENLHLTGFDELITLNNLPKGTYKLSIYVRDGNGYGAIRDFANTIVIK